MSEQGYWFDDKQMLEQAKLMWKEMGDEVRQDYGEDYFEYKVRSMPEHNTPNVSTTIFYHLTNVLFSCQL